MESAGPSSSIAYATAEDWATHRETITRLYWDEANTLREVQRIMKDVHNFHATTRMFKTRFRQWGLVKNLKSTEKEQALQSASEKGEVALPLIRGRLVGPDRLRRRLRRVAPEGLTRLAEQEGGSVDITFHRKCARTIAPTLAPATVTAAGARRTSIPRSVDVLGELKLVEQCVHAVTNWTHSRATAWGPYHDYAARNSKTTWYQDMIASHAIMESGRVQAGFRLLNISLRRFSADLLNERPLTLTGAYMCVLHFATVGGGVGPDLALSVLRHMAELSQVRLGPAHPYTRLWRGLVGLGIPAARRLARVVVETMFGFLLDHFGAHQTRFMYPHVSTLQELHAMGVISAAAAESAIRTVIDTMTRNHPAGALDFACYARTMTAKIYTQDGQYDTASAILSEFEPHIQSHSHADDSDSAIDSWSVLSWYRARSYVNQKLATCSYEETTRFFRERLDMCIRLTSPVDTWTTKAFGDLEEHYVAAGDQKGLARLREEYDLEARWDELCKRADSLAV